MSTRLAAVTESNLAAAIARLAQATPDPAATEESFRGLIADGSLLPGDMLVAHDELDETEIHGVMFAQRLGGAQAALWLPVADSEELADRLVAASVAHLAAEGHRILQAMTRIPSPPVMASFARMGFSQVSDLMFLERELAAADAELPPQRLSLAQVASSDLAFAELINATYADSLDMPELNDQRSAAELLASCRQSAKVDPPLWWYARFQERNIGVLQLAPGESLGDFELLYMGLVPAARGQGFGAELTRLAVAMAARCGGSRLHLSRDVRNRSAGRIYDQLGFRETHRRAVWLKIFRVS